VTASSWRAFDQRKSRSQVPIVDGARYPSNNARPAPTSSSATSSIESPPASIDPITVSALVALFAPWRASRNRASISSASPSFWVNAAAGNSPAADTRFDSS
jgi:hypothetical protein